MSTYILVIAIVILITGYTSITTSQKHLESQIKNSFMRDLNLLSDILKNEYLEKDNYNFSEFIKYYSDKMDFRITIIDSDGVVLEDSEKESEKFSNHSERSEFKDALEGEIAFVTRYSESMGTYYIYYAEKLECNSNSIVLRISMPLLEIQALKTDILNSSINGILLGICVAIIVSLIFSKRFSNPIKELTVAVENVADGNYGKNIYVSSNDEIGKLTTAFNLMSRELKYTIEELKDRNMKLEAILNSMTNGVVAIDADYNIILSNYLCCEFFNINQSDIINKPLYEVIRNSQIFNLLEKSAKSDEYVVEEVIYNNDIEKIFRIYANPINKNMGTVLVIEDVTQIRKLERMRSDFVSNVTHELKTPLTSIKGFIDTLKNGAINEPTVAERFLDIIDIETERLYKLIQEILTLSEIESRDIDINMNRIKIHDLVNTVEKILQPLAYEKQINLNFVIEAGMIDLFCNKERISQLLINLIDNAIKYTEKGSVEVKFTNDSNALVITVKDSGIGIPEKSIGRLFERFYRVDKGRSRKVGGTGLGLSIVKHIVILYKGKINVTSKIAEGSMFKVTLPIFYKI